MAIEEKNLLVELKEVSIKNAKYIFKKLDNGLDDELAEARNLG